MLKDALWLYELGFLHKNASELAVSENFFIIIKYSKTLVSPYNGNPGYINISNQRGNQKRGPLICKFL